MNFNKKLIKSEYSLKRGIYATVLTVVFIACIVGINVLATALAERFPINIDLSSSKVNSLSRENVSFIKKIDCPVTITVCATEQDYRGSYLKSYASSYFKADDNQGYFAQTITLLHEYEKYNKNISVRFVDPSTPQFKDIYANFSDVETIYYGDLLIEATVNAAGKSKTNRSTVTFSDIYKLEDTTGYAEYGYANYSVAGINLEAALAKTLFAVTSAEEVKIAVLATHTDSETISSFSAVLQDNSYEIVELSDWALKGIPSEYDGILISSPKRDFSMDEIGVIDAFLENEGQKGKLMLCFSGTAGVKTPVLNEYLNGWGIDYCDGLVYETDRGNYYQGNPTTPFFINAESALTPVTNKEKLVYICDSVVPMDLLFDSHDSITTSPLLVTTSTAVLRPWGVGEDWKPTSQERKSYNVGVASVDKNGENKSTVLAFGSFDLVSGRWSSSVGNTSLIVEAVGSAVGIDSTGITFAVKSFENENISELTSNALISTVRVLFMYLVPAATVIIGIGVWRRRKNR